MQAIKAYTQIFKDFEGQKVLQKLELIGRTCYKSEDKITEDIKSLRYEVFTF